MHRMHTWVKFTHSCTTCTHGPLSDVGARARAGTTANASAMTNDNVHRHTALYFGQQRGSK